MNVEWGGVTGVLEERVRRALWEVEELGGSPLRGGLILHRAVITRAVDLAGQTEGCLAVIVPVLLREGLVGETDLVKDLPRVGPRRGHLRFEQQDLVQAR